MRLETDRASCLSSGKLFFLLDAKRLLPYAPPLPTADNSEICLCYRQYLVPIWLTNPLVDHRDKPSGDKLIYQLVDRLDRIGRTFRDFHLSNISRVTAFCTA